MADQARKRLQEYANAFQTHVAYLCEARIRQLAVEQVDFFVESYEGGLNDGALYVGSGTFQNKGGAAHTLFVQLSKHHGEKVLAPLDVKRCTPKCDSKRGVQFYIKISPGQRQSCQALILVSPKEPDFVGLIPFHYLPSKGTVEDGVSFAPIRPLWTLHPLPAFPPEYTSFIFPVQQLGNRLENMRAYFDRSSNVWGNEYTGATFTDIPPPKLFDASVLEPTQDTQTRARNRMRRYFEAFRTHSIRFRVDVIGVRPYLGDMKIVEKSTGQEVMVELKEGYVQVGRQAVLRHVADDFRQRPIFSWKAHWDYILTTDEIEGIAYMLPRDKIPANWWNASRPPHGVLEMSVGFEEYSIDHRGDGQIVRDIEKILNMTQSKTGSMRAQKVIPVSHSNEPLDQVERGLGVCSDQRWSTSGYRRGFGSADHGELRGETYAVWASEVLIESCRASGQYVVLDFGKYNPICRFAIAYYAWSESNKLRHDSDGEPPCRVWDLPRNTPVVPLSFVTTDWTGDWQPLANRNLVSGATNIAKRPASFVVLDLYPESSLRLRHGRFVFASEHLKSSLERSARGVLKEGLLDQYYVDSDDLINVITAPLRGESQVTLGRPGTTIQAADYCHLIKDLHQAGVDAILSRGGQAD